MKYFLLVLAIGALAKCEEDRSLETAINFVKDCQGDYILCVKVIIISFLVKVLVWSVKV